MWSQDVARLISSKHGILETGSTSPDWVAGTIMRDVLPMCVNQSDPEGRDKSMIDT